MALIAGNTLTDLSRNSLIDDASRQGAYENAMNRARRAYEYENLSAQDRERTNQLAADNALRRELGLGDIGVRNRAVDVQERVGMGDIGVRRDIGMGDIALRGELGRGDLAYKNQLLGIEKDLRGSGLEIDADRVKAQREAIASAERVGTLNAITPLAPWMYGQTEAQRQAGRLQEMALNNQLAIGVMPYTKATAGESLNWDIQNRMLEGGGPASREMTNASIAFARNGNLMLNSARDAAFGTLVQDIDSQWFTSPTEALAAADVIRKSIDSGNSASSLNLSGKSLDAARKYEAAVANAKNDVLDALGEGRGYVEFAGGRFNAIDYRPGQARQQRGDTSSAGAEQQLAGPPVGEARTRVIADGIVEDRLPDGTWVRRQQSPPSSQAVSDRNSLINRLLVGSGAAEEIQSGKNQVRGMLAPAIKYGVRSLFGSRQQTPLPPVEQPQYQRAPDFGLPPVEPNTNDPRRYNSIRREYDDAIYKLDRSYRELGRTPHTYTGNAYYYDPKMLDWVAPSYGQ